MAAKILGQLVGTGSLVTLYAVPAGNEAVTSTVVVSNTGTTTAAVTIEAAPGGAASTLAHCLLKAYPLAAGQRLAITEGWTLAAGDTIRMNAPAAVAATLFGSQVPA